MIRPKQAEPTGCEAIGHKKMRMQIDRGMFNSREKHFAGGLRVVAAVRDGRRGRSGCRQQVLRHFDRCEALYPSKGQNREKVFEKAYC